MNGELDTRTNKVLDFINAKAKQKENEKIQNEFNASTELKYRRLNSEYQKAPSICIDTILGRLYKDALPFDDPKKNCSDDCARDEITDYISGRTCGKNSEWYVREAIKKNNSSVLQNLLTEAISIAKKFYSEKSKNISKINLEDLNFKMNNDSDDLSKITKKLEFDEISNIIQANVQKALQDESDKAKREEEYNQKIEDQLAQDINVVDDASMEAAIERMNIVRQPTVYQPSLFEAILLSKAKMTQESVGSDIISEAIEEYTKLNITKALRLEKFDLYSIRNMANSYLK